MRVLLITSDREQCGIREYGQMLMDAMPRDFDIVEFPNPSWNDYARIHETALCDIIHLNHHAALHATWRAPQIDIVHAWGKKIVVTQHDTFQSIALMQERGFPDFRGADALVVHEPVRGLTHGNGTGNGNVYWIRQGIIADPEYHLVPRNSDILWAGTCGFPFPHKNIDTICMATHDAGWGILIIAPGATIEQCVRWTELNPHIEIIPTYLNRYEIVQHLSGCAATVFHPSTGGSGTTGPIRLGIAARKPVISTSTKVNRQVRDLATCGAICWADDRKEVADTLTRLATEGIYYTKQQMEVMTLAMQDSWENVAAKYIQIYRGVLREVGR